MSEQSRTSNSSSNWKVETRMVLDGTMRVSTFQLDDELLVRDCSLKTGSGH